MTYKLRSSRSVFFKNHFSFSRNRRKLLIFSIFSPKIYLLLCSILESTQIQAKTSTEQIKTPVEAFFFKFRLQTQNINFWRSHEKISEKKCASIFSKEVSKESPENTDKKVGLRQEIFKFQWLNKSKRYFWTSFRKFSLDNLVGSTLGYHPKSIWTIFKDPNAS